jgi:hypothetical protein
MQIGALIAGEPRQLADRSGFSTRGSGHRQATDTIERRGRRASHDPPCVAAGAAAATAPAVVARACVQAVDAYGRIYWWCA